MSGQLGNPHTSGPSGPGITTCHLYIQAAKAASSMEGSCSPRATHPMCPANVPGCSADAQSLCSRQSFTKEFGSCGDGQEWGGSLALSMALSSYQVSKTLTWYCRRVFNLAAGHSTLCMLLLWDILSWYLILCHVVYRGVNW